MNLKEEGIENSRLFFWELSYWCNHAFDCTQFLLPPQIEKVMSTRS